MQDQVEGVTREGQLFLTLQGAIGVVVTVSLALQGWMLLSIHQLGVDTAIIAQKVADGDERINRISVGQKENRDHVVDQEARLKVLEDRSRFNGRRASLDPSKSYE